MMLGTTAFRRTAASIPEGRTIARRRLLAIMIATPIFATFDSGARAQSPPGRALPDTSAPVKLTLEERHIIKELVKDMKVEAVAGDAPTVIGHKVPERVLARPIPVEIGSRVPQIRSHAFYVKDDNIVLVNPKDRTVSDVIN